MRKTTRLTLGLTLAAALTLGTGGAALAAPPAPVDEAPFTFEGVCPFPVVIALQGKGATLELPADRLLAISPGLTATLSNAARPQSQVTLGITGAFHVTTLPNGVVETVVTGRNLLFDPIAGFVLAAGRFSFAFDAGGNLVQPLSGEGKLTDVCALLA